MMSLLISFSCKKTDYGTLKYEVTCTKANLNITYTNSTANYSQIIESGTSWSYTIDDPKPGQNYNLSASNSGGTTETLTCKIYYSGKVGSEATDQDYNPSTSIYYSVPK